MCRTAFLAVALCSIVLVLIDQPSPAPIAFAQGKKDSAQRDLDTLKKVFGANEVSVLLLHQAQPVQGRIVDVIDVFGKRFLQITDDQGRNHLLNPELITAIRQK